MTEKESKRIDDEESPDLVEKAVGRFKNNALIIACGQGGSRLGNAISMKFKTTNKNLYINTSIKDIDSLGVKELERLIKIGTIENVEGAGKDRSVGEKLLKEYKNEVLEQIKINLLKESYDFVFITFSTSGGTGGGIGPKVTALVNSDFVMEEVEKKFGKIPLVFGVAALPEITVKEGNISYKNTLMCLEDIKKFVSNETARYILVNNGFDPAGTSTLDRIPKLDNVNAAAATVIYRYFAEFGISRVSNLDRADRLGALNTMGLHSFMVLNEDGGRESKLNPFFIPDGERIKRICYEVPETMEKSVNLTITRTGVISDDQITGLYDTENKENSKLIPIVGFHGFKNIEKIAEQYDKRIKLNEENAKRIEENNVAASTGLDDVADIVKKTQEEYGRHGAKSLDDIFD